MRFIRFNVGSLGRAKGSCGAFGFAWVHSGTPRCLPVHSGSCVFTRSRLEVVGFIRVRVGSLLRPNIRRGRSCVFTGARLVVVGFNGVRVGSMWRS